MFKGSFGRMFNAQNVASPTSVYQGGVQDAIVDSVLKQESLRSTKGRAYFRQFDLAKQNMEKETDKVGVKVTIQSKVNFMR